MKDLKILFENLNFIDVITYIQSGNVIFKTTIKRDFLAEIISKEIKNKYDYDISIIIKTPTEIRNLVKNNPFLIDKNIDSKKLYITYLDRIPTETIKLDAFDFGKDIYTIKNDIVYLKFDLGAGKSKLSNNIIEKKLQVIATTRNWRTTNKLVDLCKNVIT